MAFKKTKGSFDSRGGAGRSFDRSDRPRFNDRASGGRSDRPFTRSAGNGPVELFDVKCAKCGVDTKVPFKPTGERPVYCRDCFNNTDSFPPKKFDRSDRAPASSGASASELREINEKLDKIMEALDIE